MQIKDMFRKKIDREIQGVIIVGQGEETNVAQELEEYVVTRELQRHFADFFAAYKKGIQGTTPKMGVWISGFFGSGKSHFLKILSYLLQNKQVGDKHAIDYFIEDQKITNQMVLADMQLAANTPSDVILFNIDSKSDSNGKENKDAIVNVFLKVFNEMQGFCGSMPHLADLERRLSEEGRFEEFKEKFEEEYGDPWESSRQDFDFIQDSVVDVLSDMDFMSESAARNWCEKATEGYQISIEDFAKRVKSYIEKKGNNHHVVFLVDEIGQYIGDDSKLMLNLQTVTEELGKECMGKAWVIVTSQQDIDSITKVKGNDFSKIQGRFDTRLSLSSANVDAVIKKRILDKTETAAQSLRLLYDQKATIIKNLIVFNDGVEKKLYANAEDFAEVYPFVPYQFNLLASVLTSIRTHGASGKHLSEGERSMLALFKESAMQLMDDEMGAIVPFYRFYDALENFLDHSHSSVIIRAYDNSYINPEKKEKDVFAINVLKTLFLIKYVLEIEANVDNIVSLMITSIDDDRISLKAQVEDALKVLMRQMLIQKNGSIYVFLTDEEQEINNEIEKENVEMPEVITKIAEMIYEDIFSSKKYQYPSFGGRYAFSFNQTVDDRPYKANQNYDIGLRVLTPWYEGGTDDGTLRLLSGQGKEVLVVLPNDDAFLTEMRAYLKIERFLRKNTSVQLAKYETIKEAKRVEMRERNGNAKLYLTEALKEATIYVNGDVLHTSGKEVTSRINEAIGRLVQTVYHKTSSLFDPFPPEMGTDTAFLDRLHCYIPGWEIPKFRPEHFTNDYGFITDYLAEFIRELRKEQYGDALDKYFRLGKNLNQRDTIAVRKIVGGYVKLLYPDGEFTKEQIEEILVFALEMRRRVKEQLKKLGGMEFYDVNFSYIDLDTFEEKFVSVPEQGGGKLIPDGICNPGQVYTVSQGKSGMIGVFRLESQMLPGNGKFERTGLGSDRDCKESTNTAFNFLKANGNRISGSISTPMRDYIINYQDLQGIGMTGKLALPTLIALCSIALGRPTVSTLAVLGEISISGTILKVDELANSLQVCLDSGAKKVLLPITSAADLGTVPPELVGSFNLIFYSSAEDAVFKALGVE